MDRLTFVEYNRIFGKFTDTKTDTKRDTKRDTMKYWAG
jgi:hypothetical protein